jgi:CubicO group peptidase (beta-lactamase class C family)
MPTFDPLIKPGFHGATIIGGLLMPATLHFPLGTLKLGFRHMGMSVRTYSARSRAAVDILGGLSMRIANCVRGGLAILAFCAALATSSLAGGLPRDFDQYITSGMEAWKIPGLSVVVVKDGEVVLAKGYGVLEAGAPEEVNEDTIFAIGSASKAFTAAAIGTLVDRGKVKWDDRVVDHWPEFKLSDPWVTNEIRVSDLLANHSGLSEVAEEIWYGTGYDRQELIERLAGIPITQGFRYQFQYRNLMFLAAGELIPRLVGASWDDFVTTALFKPLDMDRTTTRLADIENQPNVAQPHLIDYAGNPLPIRYRNIDNVGPAGSIMSTARSMGNWVRMLADGGVLNGEPLLKPETFAFIERSQTPVDTVGPGGEPLSPPAELRAYALSWVTESYQGTRLVWHNGSIDGMSAWVGMAPDLRLGVVILSNLDDANLRNAIFYRIVDSYTDHELTDLGPELLEQRQVALDHRDRAEARWQALNDAPVSPALPTKDYAGTYRNPSFGEVEISLESDQLVYRRTPTMIAELRCQQDNVFLGKYRGVTEDLRAGKIEVGFQVEGGRVTGFSEENLLFQIVD